MSSTVEFQMQGSYGDWMPYEPATGDGLHFQLTDEAARSGRKFRARCVGADPVTVLVMGRTIEVPPTGTWVLLPLEASPDYT